MRVVIECVVSVVQTSMQTILSALACFSDVIRHSELYCYSFMCRYTLHVHL